MFWQGAFFVQKILNGAKPADIPVQTPQRFELVINLKTAKAIGVTISEAVLLRADRSDRMTIRKSCREEMPCD